MVVIPMEQSTRRSPPPLPESDPEPNRVTVVAVVLGIALLLAVLFIAMFASGDRVADGDGAGNVTTGDGDGSGPTNGGDAEEGSTGESVTVDDGSATEQDETSENDGESGAGGNDSAANAESKDSAEKDISADHEGVGNSESGLPPGLTLEGPQSERGVRNTFNPFGGEAPPNSSSPQKSEPGAPGKSAEFFGVAAEGKSFVYVVDKSSSMMGEKFEDARDELIKSINALRPNQSFFVIFFDTSYHLQETSGLVKANSRNKKKVKEWIDLADPFGATEPFEAIEQALDLKPDAIFVLSDGEFGYYLADQVQAINDHFTIPIHTIAFTTNAQTLKDLADQNKGTYRFVP